MSNTLSISKVIDGAFSGCSNMAAFMLYILYNSIDHEMTLMVSQGRIVYFKGWPHQYHPVIKMGGIGGVMSNRQLLHKS